MSESEPSGQPVVPAGWKPDRWAKRLRDQARACRRIGNLGAAARLEEYARRVETFYHEEHEGHEGRVNG